MAHNTASVAAKNDRRLSPLAAGMFRSLLAVAVVSIVCASLAPAASAQQGGPNVQHTENKVDLALKGEARVDPSTLGMGISITLASYPGRAGLGLPVAVSYSSKVWRLRYDNVDSTPITGLKTWTRAVFAEHSTAGWTSTLAPPRVEFTGIGQYYDSQGRGACELCLPGQTSGSHYVKRIYVHMPGGSSHELRLDDRVYFTSPQEPFTGTFYAVDGSRMRFESNAGGACVLYLPDGARYLFPPYDNGSQLTATQHVDRHGNTLTYDPANRRWADTLNRIIADPLPQDPQPDTETYFTVKLVGGGEATYTFRWKRLAGAQTTPDPANPPPQLHYSGDQACAHNSYPTFSPWLFNSATETRVCLERDPQGNPVRFNPVVLAEIELPTHNKYRFTYNVYGEIDRVFLPTGGMESFTYAPVQTLSYTTAPYDKTNRGVTRREVRESAGAEKSVWTYGVTSTNPYTVRTTLPDSTYTERMLHRGLNTGPQDDFVRFGFDDARAGRAYEERVYSVAGVMLRRSLTQWDVAGPTPGASHASRDPKVMKAVTILLDTDGANALWASTVNRYGQASQPLNPTSVTEYGYASTMDKETARVAAIDSFNPLDSLAARTMETAYLDSQPYFDRGLTALPVLIAIKKGPPAGALVALTQTRYDEPSFPLLTCGAAVGWSDPGSAARGNPTTTSKRLYAAGGHQDLETHAQYDACGNLRKTWDARDAQLSNPTQIEYDDSFSDGVDRNSFAYPTRKLTADPDGGGALAALESGTEYDFQTGLAVLTTDANSQATSFSYSDEQGVRDPLNRLRGVMRPDGGWTKYDYGNTPGDLFVRARAAIDASRNTENRQYFDGLGRPMRLLTHDGSAPEREWIVTDTEYDVMSRVKRASNPYFVQTLGGSGDPASVHWTATVYDPLGRIQTVTTPDGAQVATAHAGNETTVTDQAGNKRRSVADALGRLSRVVEAPEVVGYGYETAYEYDALDNLTKVIQGEGGQTLQTRVFVYDSLSRLAVAQNPESGAVFYTYDENSNLQTRTDARNVTASYVYDALNRLTSRNYSDATPDVTYTYDAAGVPNSKGRLTSVSSSASTYDYTAYDAMGRVRGSSQTTGGVTHAMPDYSYNLAGGLVSQQYPSGKIVRTEYDVAGRIAGLKNQTTGRFYAGALAGDAVNRFRYTAHGAAAAVRLGNGLWERTDFNSRLQPERIGLGTSSTDSSKLQLEYSYGPAQSNNGNLRSQRIRVVGGLDLTQTYEYDPVNRLLAAREEQTVGSSQTWKQSYTYLDATGQNGHFGNRQIDISIDPAIGQPRTTANVTPQHNPTINPANNRFHDHQGFAYDTAVGNLTADPQHTYEYDAENRLVRSDGGASTASSTAATYVYDGGGRRVMKFTSMTRTVFVYNAMGQLVAEYSNQTAPAGRVSYLTQDYLGSTRVITDADGQPASRHDYLPFGEEISIGSVTSSGRENVAGYGIGDIRQRFTGKERDDETRLDFMKARYYASAQGRFTSPDPLGFWMLERKKQDEHLSNPQRWNKYVYVLNNPLRYVDPTGMAEVPVWSQLSEELRRDLAQRGITEELWNEWRKGNRAQQVLNFRAAMIAAGTWGEVGTIMFGHVETNKDGSFKQFVIRDWGSFLSFTTTRDIRPDLEKAGYKLEDPKRNHKEAGWTYKQKGPDIVGHVIQLSPPHNDVHTFHFDGGGGGWTVKHVVEVVTNSNPSVDEVTQSFAGTSAAEHLRGISAEMDKLLTPKK